MKRRTLSICFWVAALLWLAVPAQAQITCDASDPTTTVTLQNSSDSYSFTFCGSHFDGTNTTFKYKVAEVSGRSLSHWVIGLCVSANDIVSFSPTASAAGIAAAGFTSSDPTTGVRGFKWDLEENFDETGGDQDDMREFTITLAGFYGETSVEVGAKAGPPTNVNNGSILGPDCSSGACVPGNLPNWDGNLTIDTNENLARVVVNTPNGFHKVSILGGSSNVALHDIEGIAPGDLNKTNDLNGSVRNGSSMITYTGGAMLTQVTIVFTPLEQAGSRFLFSIEDKEACDLQVDPVFTAVLPDHFTLHGNYPNPFNPTTSISFDIPASTDVKLQVFDITGRLVQTLVNGKREAGYHEVTFQAQNLPSGLYFYRLDAGTFSTTGKMTLLK